MGSTQRTIIVGDVHGCFDELKDLLKTCKYNRQTDRLIFVGDLINKGPKSLETLQFVRDNDLEAVIGNHELKFLKKLDDEQALGTSLRELKRKMGKEVREWARWIQSWPAFIEDDDFLVVHAGLVPGKRPAETPVEILANIRTWDGKGMDLNDPSNPAWHELYKGKKLVIYGHWAVQGLTIKENSIGLDSGCVYGRKLSALLLPERTVAQTQARKVYLDFMLDDKNS